jgi:DNA-binding CsgD family transcriptional regulator
MPYPPDQLPDCEPPIAVLDAIYDDFVRVRITPRALAMAREWLGALSLDLLDPEQLVASAGGSVLMNLAAIDGESVEQAPVLLARWSGADDLSPLRRNQFDALVRHIQRARTFRAKLVETRRIGDVFNSGLDRLSIGVMTIFPNGRPIAANRIASEMLQAGDGVSLVAGKVALAFPADQKAFRDICNIALSGAVPQGALCVGRPSGKADLNLLILRPPPKPGVMRSGLRILLRDPEQQTIHSRNALRDLYGLTDTEAAVTIHLANGLSAEEVEARFGIRHNTMRAHLRSIYAKIGVSSHAELVYSILAGVSAIALENPDELPPLEPEAQLLQ